MSIFHVTRPTHKMKNSIELPSREIVSVALEGKISDRLQERPIRFCLPSCLDERSTRIRITSGGLGVRKDTGGDTGALAALFQLQASSLPHPTGHLVDWLLVFFPSPFPFGSAPA